MIGYAEILIVDDMPDQIAYSGSLLRAEGYRVFAATSPEAMWRVLENRLPDLILLDIQLGEVSGLDICKALRQCPRTKDIPIIFLTSQTGTQIISQGFELGGSDYVRKPFIQEEFLARIKTQLRLFKQRKELIAANDELSQFCSAVTHDLKAPFNIVNMLIEMLRQELGEEQPESITAIMDMICAKATQARIMIERLFEFSKMCNVKPCVKEVDVNAIAEDIFLDLRRLEPERNLSLICEKLPTVIADEALVHMAMKNLLQNAVKYTSKEEHAVIRVTAEHDPAYYVIQVRDNGVGFDMAYAGKLFQVFERLHTEEEFQGSGVGLALVNRIMLRHNGRIEAWGAVGEGAEFTLYFPKNPAVTGTEAAM